MGQMALAVAGISLAVALYVASQASVVPAQNGLALSDQERVDLRALGLASTVRVAAQTCDGLMRGSGFVVDSHLLTAAHLTEGASELKVDQPVAPVFAPVARRADGLDLAATPAVSSTPLTLSPANPDVGSAILLAGHADGGATRFIESSVHLYESGAPWGVGGTVLLIDETTTGGFSGGPVLDRDGRVVGMLHGYDHATGLTLAIPSDAIRTWLSEGADRPVASCDHRDN